MHHSTSGKSPRILRRAAVVLAVPVAMAGLLLAGCAASAGPVDSSSPAGDGQVADGGAAGSGGGSSDGAVAGDQGGEGGPEVQLGDVKVGTQMPEGFPADLPLPEKAPTSVVTVGGGGGQVGGGWALNYDGVSMAEVEQMLGEAESAGYTLAGPFEMGSSQQWGLKSGTTSVLVLFSEDANLSMTVTMMP